MDYCHQQNCESCKILLLDSGRLYLIQIEGVLQQILEGHHNFWQQEQNHVHSQIKVSGGLQCQKLSASPQKPHNLSLHHQDLFLYSQ